MKRRKSFLLGIFCAVFLFSAAIFVSPIVSGGLSQVGKKTFLIKKQDGTKVVKNEDKEEKIEVADNDESKDEKTDEKRKNLEDAVEALAHAEVCGELKEVIVKAVYKEAEERELDGCIVIAMIRQESNFNPNVIGRDKEVGLMQIMGRYWYKYFGFKSRSKFEKALRDPEFNIMAGTSILEYCLDSRGGDYQRALKCYNGSSKYPPLIMKHYKKAGCKK